MKTYNKHNIDYFYPEVSLLHATPLVNAEIAGRTAYDSFKHSEHEQIRDFTNKPVDEIESSELMNQLCHVYFHDSVMEHINLTFNIRGISRGVLQELVRHRIASYTVKSTRYTMKAIICAFATAYINEEVSSAWEFFYRKIKFLDMFSIAGKEMTEIEIKAMYYKLDNHSCNISMGEFFGPLLSKEQYQFLSFSIDNSEEVYNTLMSMKAKRNAGDAIKYLVTDNWKTDLVMTINLRSLKNLLTLRDSGAAYFQIQVLAQEMKKVIPDRYLKLIVKEVK